MWWLCVQSSVYYRLSSVYTDTVSTIFQHEYVINLKNSLSEDVVMASSVAYMPLKGDWTKF